MTHSVVLTLASCFASQPANDALEAAAWRQSWALRLCPAVGVAPITRARVTIEAFTSPTDGWGEREGVAALLSWVVAAIGDHTVSGPLIALRREIQAAMADSV